MKYYRVTLQGSLDGPYEPLESLTEQIKNLDKDDFPIKIIVREMTEEEYKNLPEWTGW